MGGKRVLSRGVAVRVGAFDHRVEKDESHAGKVMEKRVYERNKDKFPYSRFEMYDPNKKWDTYTVSGAAPRAHLARPPSSGAPHDLIRGSRVRRVVVRCMATRRTARASTRT